MSWNIERTFTLHNISCVMCHMSHVTCYMSHVMCHVSHVMCHTSYFFFLTKWWTLLVEGLLSMGPTRSSLNRFFINFNSDFWVLAQKCLEPCLNGVLKFQFFFLNLSSKVLAGVIVRTTKYPNMDICEGGIYNTYQWFFFLNVFFSCKEFYINLWSL